MDSPPPHARSPGVRFAPYSVARTNDAEACGVLPHSMTEQCREVSGGDDGQLFGFESELEKDLIYLPLAVRFKLDKCGIKLSLRAWQQLPATSRHELLCLGCQTAVEIARYRQIVCTLVRECTREDPFSIPVSAHPPWTDDRPPDQLASAATATGFPVPSPTQWRALSPLQRFALLKLSREGREHRNLGPALREFGLL